MAENLSDDSQKADQNKKRRRAIFFAALLALVAAIWGIVAWIQNDAARNKSPQRVYNYIAPSREDCLKMKNSEDADFCLDRVIAALPWRVISATKSCAKLWDQNLAKRAV